MKPGTNKRKTGQIITEDRFGVQLGYKIILMVIIRQ